MRPLLPVAFFVFFAQSPFLGAFDLTTLNLNYRYNLTDEIRFKHRTVETENGLAILFEIRSDSTLNLTMDLLIQKGYSSVSHDTLRVFTIDTLLTGNRKVYKLNFVPPAKNDLIIFSIGHPSLGVYWLFDVEIGSPVGYPDFYPADEDGLPIFDPFLTSQTCILKGPDSNFHVYMYTEDFGPADPPMGQMKALSPTLKVDSSYFTGSEFTVPGLYSFYLIQKDSTEQNGITLLAQPAYFPKLKRLEELVGPLTYIATDNESSSLKVGSPNLKEVFEKFWINTYGTRLRAKGAIRVFYDWVEEANILFTDYKPGWQTDRGMIYLIFGRPEKVKRTDNTEVWTYGTTEFEFIRIPSLFTPSLYTLKRDITYDKIWYMRVGTLRKG